MLCLASALCSEAGSPWAHGRNRPFRAGSRVVCVWPRHSGGPSGRRRGHSDGVTGRALAGGWRGLGGSWLTRGAGCAEEGAPGGARGARLAVPSTPWTGRAIGAHHQPGSQPPGRHADLPSALFFLSIHPTGSRPASPATPLPHFIWLPSSPGNVLPRCKENAAGTEENSGPGPSKQSAPFSRHPSPAL